MQEAWDMRRSEPGNLRNAAVANKKPRYNISIQSLLQGNTCPAPGDVFSELRRHPYVACISDRIESTAQYPFSGREHLLDHILHSITAGVSILLVGEPGIGKRTMSLGLARQLSDFRSSYPDDAMYTRDLYSLCLGSSFWSRDQSEDFANIQENIRYIFRLVEQAGPEKIVLCIDDFDVLSFVDRLVKNTRGDTSGPSGARSPLNVSDPQISTENMLRSLICNKKVLCLCTCIKSSYQRLKRSDTLYAEKFTETFRTIHVSPPPLPMCRVIVHSHRKRLEVQHSAVIPPESLDAAVIFANAFISHRAIPQSALDLLHEACKAAHQHGDKLTGDAGAVDSMGLGIGNQHGIRSAVVYKSFVEWVIREWTGVPQEELNRRFQEEIGVARVP